MSVIDYSKLFIHAPNVHLGGGKSLLLELFASIPSDLQVVAQIDTRLDIPEHLPGNIKFRSVRPTVLCRFRAEQWISRQAASNDIVLCFGNLPPLFNSSAKIYLFLQNLYLISSSPIDHFPRKTRARLAIERLWLKKKAGNVDEFIVQTPAMMTALLNSAIVSDQSVHIRPFLAGSIGKYRRYGPQIKEVKTKYDFIYPASGEPHKNHYRLIKAWCLLAREGIFPSICLTLEPGSASDLLAMINDKQKQYGLRVENIGVLSRAAMLSFYKQAKALIYPSLLESFGLPLLEARQAGLAVVASELDYVRDILDPEESFNPESPLSIARAVKRFLDIEETCLPLLNARQFIAALKPGS